MKKNRPSHSEIQELKHGPVPSPSTPSPQSPSSLEENGSNIEQSLGEEHIYDSPPSPPHSVHPESEGQESVYSVPPLPGNSSLSEAIYDSPPSPPRSVHPESEGQEIEGSIYETSPSNRPLFQARRSDQVIYAVPPRAGQPLSRREHVYDVPSSSRILSPSESESSATPNLVDPYAVVNLDDLHAGIFDPTQLSDQQQDITRGPARNTVRRSAPPELPPRPDEFDVYEIPDADDSHTLEDSEHLYMDIPDLMQQSDQQQNVTQGPARNTARRSAPPELPPRPDELDVYEIPDADDSYVLEDSEHPYMDVSDLVQQNDQQQGVTQSQDVEAIYETIPDLPQSGHTEQRAELTKKEDSIYATVLPKALRHPKAVKQSAEEKQRKDSVLEDTPPDLPSRPADLSIDEKENPEQKITEAVVRPKVSTHSKNLKQSATRTTQKDPVGRPFRPELPPRPQSMRQGVTEGTQGEGVYAAMAPVDPLSVKRKFFRSVSETGSRQKSETVGKPFRPELPPRPQSMRQGVTEGTQGEGVYAAMAPVDPLSVKKKLFRSVSETASGQKSEYGYKDVSPEQAPPLPSKRFSYSTDETDTPVSHQKHEHVYATVSIRPPISPINEEQAISSHGEGRVLTDSPQDQSNLPRMKKSSLTRSQIEIACSAYRQEVRRLCSIVFGKEYLLDNKIGAIKKDPDLAEEVSVQIASCPEKIHKLAGVSVCGIKNKPRRTAEAGIFPLCEALTNYAKAEIYAKSMEQQRNLKTEIAPLSSKDVNRRVHRSATVQQARDEIRVLCKKVFNDPNRLDNNMKDIEVIPGIGAELSWQIRNHIHIFGKLAGSEFCGFKTSAREEAERFIPPLCKAIENYSEHVTSMKESILQSHQRKAESYRMLTDKTQHLQSQQKEIAGVSGQAKKAISEDHAQRFVHKKAAMATSI
ncbi:BID domain-containing T4SS effector [Bartonella sp. B23]